MLIGNRPVLGQLNQATNPPATTTSWIAVNVCRNCKPYSPPGILTKSVEGAQVEVYVPAPVGKTFRAKTRSDGFGPVELPVPVGTSVQISVTADGETQRKVGVTGSDPGSGIINFQFNVLASSSNWTFLAIAGGLLAIVGAVWWMRSRKKTAGVVFEPSLAEVVKRMSRGDLRNVRSKILKNIRKHCSEVYAPGSPEHEACRTAAAIAAAEVTDVFEEYGVDIH